MLQKSRRNFDNQILDNLLFLNLPVFLINRVAFNGKAETI